MSAEASPAEIAITPVPAEVDQARLDETFTGPSDLVTDPFAGGGTTPMAAAKLGREVIATEADEEAYETTLTRVARA